MIRAVVLYPRGGGGSWLAHTFYLLENSNSTLVTPSLVFDKLPQGTLKVRHKYEIVNGQRKDYTISPSESYKLFSTNKPFNLYLNDSLKVRFNPESPVNILNQSSVEQFTTLTNSAVYIASDSDYADAYYKNIDLVLDDVFQRPEQFVSNLFDLLDSLNLKYTKDAELVMRCIHSYRQTCVDPQTIVGNLDHVAWLGWCHAMCMLNNQSIEQELGALDNLDQIKQALEPFNQLAVEKTKSMMFSHEKI